MLAAVAARTDPADPLSGLELRDVERPDPPQHWSVVDVRAASLNHHDLWSLRGVGLPADRLPMVLGCDAAGVTADGREVVVHAVVGATGHGVGPTERRSILSEQHPGTLAEQVAVPTWNLVAKPTELSFEEAACLPTAWLTAYRMLFRSAAARPGDRVLVQGAGGGVATAAVVLGAAAGVEVVVTSRDAAKRDRALSLGASVAVEPGARLPFRVDAVLETVGAATWAHSVRSLRPGGTIVVAGATTGDASPMELQRIFFTELTVVGATMGDKEDLEALLRMLVRTGVRPVVDSTVPLTRVHDGFRRLASGEQVGKVVVTVGD
ncbi:zinc-binding dehydrogenase [Cellulomonas carbonis]|uniref:Molecular chaperone GroES n=1 Tax=Cellulomonas carbonis T26 TaxID=947969 RepID=A0A0A0BTG1_9CELL|nr:Zn-dependent alcohol dehydrogenase [Cellulomonas carbonis]KGM10464.1 molecular chaperone GroES [Cellulomonas carbonis T26]GGC04817.1 Zn-dependent oxidoreductase [Cellulomonas carbonis]